MGTIFGEAHMSVFRRVRKICVFIGSHSCKVLAVNWAPCTHQCTCFWHLQKSAQRKLPNKNNKSFKRSVQLPLRLQGWRPNNTHFPTKFLRVGVFQACCVGGWGSSSHSSSVTTFKTFHLPQDLTHPNASTIPLLPHQPCPPTPH